MGEQNLLVDGDDIAPFVDRIAVMLGEDELLHPISGFRGRQKKVHYISMPQILSVTTPSHGRAFPIVAVAR